MSEDEARLSSAMMGYWLSFVRDGVPGNDRVVPWPRYVPGQGDYLNIETQPSAQRGPLTPAFAFADAVVEDRHRQGRAWRLDIGFSAF